jgi:hypothetical protein
LAAFAAMSAVSARYALLAWMGEIEPALMTWLLFLVGSSLSFWTHRSFGKGGIVTNIGNIKDLFGEIIIISGICLAGFCGRNSLLLKFNAFEIVCFAVAGIIFVFWRLSRKHASSHVALQALMTVAYLPTFRKLYLADQNTESFGVWSFILATESTSLFLAIRGKDRLAIFYTSRAFALVLVVVLMMIRLEI